MRKIYLFFILAISVYLTIACALPRNKKVHLYYGEQPPHRFIRVLKVSPQAVTFEIRIKFPQAHLYHIIADKNDNFLAEGWFPTAKNPRGIYRVTMRPKKGLIFQPGKTYYLCIGEASPEQTLYSSSNYKCLVYYPFTIPLR